MNISDPVADFLTRIRNALKAEHRYVDIPWSKLKQNIAEILKSQGFVQGVIVKQESGKGTMRVFLKYSKNRKPALLGLKRYSRPGLRRYVNHKEIPHFFGGLGVPILSTSQGVITGKDAFERKVGGELLCLVW